MGMPFRPRSLLSLSLSLENARGIASNYLFDENRGIFVLYSPTNKSDQNVLIHSVKEFPYVAFEDETGLGMIPAYFSCNSIKIFDASVITLTDPARKGCRDECGTEYGIQNRKNRVVEDSVTNCRLENMASLWVAYPKIFIWSMPIQTIFQFIVKVEDLLFKLPLEPCYIGLVTFTNLECIPS